MFRDFLMELRLMDPHFEPRMMDGPLARSPLHLVGRRSVVATREVFGPVYHQFCELTPPPNGNWVWLFSELTALRHGRYRWTSYSSMLRGLSWEFFCEITSVMMRSTPELPFRQGQRRGQCFTRWNLSVTAILKYVRSNYLSREWD